jgi:hypothetical protein
MIISIALCRNCSSIDYPEFRYFIEEYDENGGIITCTYCGAKCSLKNIGDRLTYIEAIENGKK